MRCNRDSFGRLLCAVTVGALAIAPLAANADDNATSTTMTMSSDTTMAPSMEPTLVNGQVVRYYVDRSGYVTAMDVQTPTGIQMVHFAPNMGQRLYSTYPVGGQIAVWVTPSMMGTGHWNAVGVGTARPATFMQPYMVSDIDALDADPYIVAGSKMTEVKGHLSRIIVGNTGEVLALVLDDNTLIRVPREFRHIAPGYAGSDRITPLFKGAEVRAVGYVEAPMYGVLSPYMTRIAPNAISVNGRSVGALGVPMMTKEQQRTLIKADIGGNQMSNEEMAAMGMGYHTYTPGGAMGGTGSTNATAGGAATTSSTPATQ
jgi:hypothetical protein